MERRVVFAMHFPEHDKKGSPPCIGKHLLASGLPTDELVRIGYHYTESLERVLPLAGIEKGKFGFIGAFVEDSEQPATAKSILGLH